MPQYTPVSRLSHFSFVLLVIGVAAISSAAVIIRAADAPPLVVSAGRMLIASVILLPFASAGIRKALKSLTSTDLVVIAIAGIALAVHFWLWITSLSYTSIASSVILVTSHPILVAVLSFVFWRERLGGKAICGIAAAVVGLLIINIDFESSGSAAVKGNMMALGAAAAMTVYLLAARHMRERISALAYLAIVYMLATIILVTAVIIAGQTFLGYSAKTYWMLALLGLVPQLIGHSSLNLAVRRLPATVVSAAILGEPVGATFLGWILLHESPGMREVFGGAIILVGILLVVRGSAGDVLEQNETRGADVEKSG